MRKLVLSLAAAGAALAVASPASAQYYGGQQPYGYGQGYGQGYGYNGYGYNNYGQVRALEARINAVQSQINRMGRYGRMRGTDRLREESRQIERRLHQASRSGLNPYEANDIQMRIARLEQRVQYASASRYGSYGRGYNGYGYNGAYQGGHDRDRDHDYDRDRDDD